MELVRVLGHPILSASLNIENGFQLNDPDIIKELYNHRVDVILDGGQCSQEVSTVLDLTEDQPIVIREGAGNIKDLIELEQEL